MRRKEVFLQRKSVAAKTTDGSTMFLKFHASLLSAKY